jgi:hypothetical protein
MIFDEPVWRLNPREPHGPQIKAAMRRWAFNPMASRYLLSLANQERPLSWRQVNSVNRVVNRARVIPHVFNCRSFVGPILTALISVLFLTACGGDVPSPTHSAEEGRNKCTAACEDLGQEYAGHTNWHEPGRYLCTCVSED